MKNIKGFKERERNVKHLTEHKGSRVRARTEVRKKQEQEKQGQKLMVTGSHAQKTGTWLTYGSDIRSEGSAWLRSRSEPGIQSGLLLWGPGKTGSNCLLGYHQAEGVG